MDIGRVLDSGRKAGKTAVVALAITSVVLPPYAYAQQGAPAAQSGQTAGAPNVGWPKDFDVGTNRLEIYQPQIETWDGNRISGRAALAIGPKDGAPTYGFAHFVADAIVDKAAGLVQLNNIRVDKVEVVTAPDKAPMIQQAIQERLPKTGLVAKLDQLQASYAVNQKIEALRTQPVDNTPPRIIFADTATILVPISGEPAMRSVEGAPAISVCSTPARSSSRTAAASFHLQAAGTWYESNALNGTWLVTPKPTAALQEAAKAALKQAEADPLLNKDGKPITPPPGDCHLHRSHGTDPDQRPAPDAAGGRHEPAHHEQCRPRRVHGDDQQQLLCSDLGPLVQGSGHDGPWTYVASDALPPDFKNISPNDPQANVLVSVAGTPQAKEAAIAATIPQTSTVKRSATTKVTYAGAPQFAPIEGTAMKYAVNTAQPVIMVSPDRYFVVVNGVWFTSASPTGPWVVAAEVPPVIYTIPVSSPVYYVTYVRVYSVQPETVVVGYTPGYMGVIVAPGGTVVYGTGYTYPAYVARPGGIPTPPPTAMARASRSARGGLRLRFRGRLGLGRGGRSLLGSLLGRRRLEPLGLCQCQRDQCVWALGRLRHCRPCLGHHLERHRLERPRRLRHHGARHGGCGPLGRRLQPLYRQLCRRPRHQPVQSLYGCPRCLQRERDGQCLYGQFRRQPLVGGRQSHHRHGACLVHFGEP